MAQAAFIVTSLLSVAYFLYRFRADPLALAFGACLIYFMPAFFGYVGFSTSATEQYVSDIAPHAYAVMGMVLLSVTFATVAYDWLIPASHGQVRLGFGSNVSLVMFVFLAVFTAISAYRIGPYFTCLDKELTLSKLDSFYYYAAYALPLATASALATGRPVLFVLGIAIALVDVYGGFRVNAAFTFLSVALLLGGWLRESWRKAILYFLLLAAIGGAFFLVAKVGYNLKYAAAGYCDAALIEDAIEQGVTVPPSATEARPATADQLAYFSKEAAKPEFYASALLDSEPFVIQSTLNEVVKQSYTTDASYIFRQILTGVPGGATLFGIDPNVPSFNSLAQPALFPDVEFGMANNPWAQAYAAGALWMVFAFAATYAGSVLALNVLFDRSAGALRAFAAVLAACIGFYFHRNDVLVQVGMVKHLVYIFAFCVVIGGTVRLASVIIPQKGNAIAVAKRSP